MERSWLAKHGGSVLSDGTTVASPSGVNVCLSSLSTGFSLLGRVGSWSPVTPQGNPIQSAGLLHWRKGYRLQSWRRGYKESSAVPMTSNKASQLVDLIDSQAAAASNTMEVFLYQRDALIALLMWESCLRGVDCGKLRLQDFFLPSGSSAQLPLPEPLSAGSQLVIRPNGSKTVKGRRAGAISLVHTGSDVHCSLPRLMRYLGARAAAGMPVGQFLFSASTRSHNGFVDAAFCSSSIGKRLSRSH